ncbi:MAG: Gfo/Idh/MocA family protein [Anaerolineales bacterium]|jgi:predicted dehydrogenase
MAKIRWGLLSTANINRAVIPAMRASARGELAAVASRSQASADAYAAKWEIPQAFGSYEDMLASDQIDAVYIGLPNHLHAEWSIKAMQAGKHVLCEKPLALSVEEVDRMAAASRETGCYLAEAFMYRHHPQTRLVRELVQRGDLGEICVVTGAFNFTLHGQDNVRLVPEYGGGCLWDVGVYPLSFAQMVYGGPPERVFGEQWLGASGIDETFAGQMAYPGGGVAQITSSFRQPFHTDAEILGTEGRLSLTRPFNRLDDGRQMVFYPHEGEPHEIPVPEEYLYQGEVEDLHSAVLDGTPPLIPLAQSRDHVRTVAALYESARRWQPVELK